MREQDLVAYGSKLKKFRQEQKLDLKSIAERTKINISYLRNLEEGNFDFLPEIYVRSFLKLYLQQLGGDWTDLLDEYDDLRSKKSTKMPAVPEIEIAEPPKRWNIRDQLAEIINKIKPYLRQMHAVWLGLIVVIIFFALVALVKFQRSQTEVRAQPEIAIQQPNLITKDTSLAPVDSNQIASLPETLTLELRALEKTWLQIVVDDSLAKELTFESGANGRWQARSRFKLRIGNAAGVRLYLNGQDLGKLGHAGEVVKFDLTDQGIQKSTL